MSPVGSGPRVLFFPSYRGGGFGHIGRCLALAEELARQGGEPAFVLGGPHAGSVARAGWPVFRPRWPPLSARLRRRLASALHRPRTLPAYLFFSDLNFQVVRDGFLAPQIVQREVEWELGVVRRFRPHLLVGDAWLLTSIVGRLASLPVVQIIRAAAHPACPQLVWWRSLPPQIRSPDVAWLFNPLLERWGLPPIRRAEDLLDGDLLLVPSIPALDPLPQGVEHTRYIGPLVRAGRNGGTLSEELESLQHGRPVVYVTLGGGSESVRAMDLLPLWEAAFSGTGWQVVVSTGGQPLPHRRQGSPDLRVFPWLPGAATVARADVVLFHGGYGTMMETVRAGVPSVVIPFHAEQEGNGRRLQQVGQALVLAPSEENLEPLEGRWSGGTFTLLACRHFHVRPQEVREAVLSILHDDRYRTAAARMRQQVNGGAALAVKYVKDLTAF